MAIARAAEPTSEATEEAARDTHELAWAAGFYDGEGSCSGRYNRHGNRRGYLRFNLGQKDPRPLHRFHRAMGVGQIYVVSKNGKPYYEWMATNMIDTAVVANLLWPYLSEPKREQYARKYEEARASRLERDR